MKKIILTESDITKIIRKTIETKLNEDKFSVEPEVLRQPRERDIDSLFGKYTYHVPDDVIRYMRKNPALIVKRLLDIYGEDKLMNYVDMARNPKEMDMRLDNDSLRDELGEDHTKNPNDKYEVKPCKNKKMPFAVWEGDVKVKEFKTRKEAQDFANKENKEQSLNEMFRRLKRNIK
jgi:hypothetical protein